MALRQARRRIHLIHLLRVLPLSLLCAAAIAALMLIGGKWHKLSYFGAWGQVVPTLIPLVICAAYVQRTRLSALDVARQLERRAGLQERFSSAIEFQAQGVDVTLPFYAAQWADADQRAAQLNVPTLFPIRTGRTLAASAAAAMLVFIACRIPTPPSIGYALEEAQAQQEAATVRSAGAVLQKKADDTTLEAGRYDMARTRQAAQEAANLAIRMQHSKLDKRQSLVALQKLTQHFEQQIKQLDTQPVRALNADANLPATQTGLSSRPTGDPEPSQQTNTSAPMQTHQSDRLDDLPLDRNSPPVVQQTAQGPQRTSKTALPPSAHGKRTQQTELPGQQKKQPLTPTASANDTSPPGKLQIMRDSEGLRRMTQALQDTRRQISRSGVAGSGGRDPGQGVNGQAQTPRIAATATNKTPQMDSHGLQSTKSQRNTPAGRKERDHLNASSRATANLTDARSGKTPSEQDSEMPTASSSTPLPARTHAPYYMASETDRRQAESALSRENVPAAYKQQVKDYFDSINAPARRSRGPE